MSAYHSIRYAQALNFLFVSAEEFETDAVAAVLAHRVVHPRQVGIAEQIAVGSIPLHSIKQPQRCLLRPIDIVEPNACDDEFRIKYDTPIRRKRSGKQTLEFRYLMAGDATHIVVSIVSAVRKEDFGIETGVFRYINSVYLLRQRCGERCLSARFRPYDSNDFHKQITLSFREAFLYSVNKKRFRGHSKQLCCRHYRVNINLMLIPTLSALIGYEDEMSGVVP